MWPQQGSAGTEERCRADKHRQAGSYAVCLANEVKKAILNEREIDLSLCAEHFARRWQAIEDKGLGAGLACTTEDGDDIASFVEAHVAEVARALSGVEPAFCGDGAVNTVGELCDGDNLGLETCESLGLGAGALGCQSDCSFDVAACRDLGDTCGDGELDPGEDCDFGLLGDMDCETISEGALPEGEVRCGAGCAYDASDCHPVCTGHQEAGACWFLAELGQSCDEACDDRTLEYDGATQDVVGSSGTLSACKNIARVLSGLRLDRSFSRCGSDPSAGCIIRPNRLLEQLFHCSAEPTTATASEPGYQRVCACR